MPIDYPYTPNGADPTKPADADAQGLSHVEIRVLKQYLQNKLSVIQPALDSTVQSVGASGVAVQTSQDSRNPVIHVPEQTSAGILSTIYLTAETEVVDSITYYSIAEESEGSVLSASQSKLLPIVGRWYYLQEFITAPSTEEITYPAGTYSGTLTCESSTAGGTMSFGMDIQVTDSTGNNPVPIFVLDSGIIATTTGIKNVGVSGVLSSDYVRPINTRVLVKLWSRRWTGSPPGTLTVYCGSNHKTSIKVPKQNSVLSGVQAISFGGVSGKQDITDPTRPVIYSDSQYYLATRAGSTDDWDIDLPEPVFGQTPPNIILIKSTDWTGIGANTKIRYGPVGNSVAIPLKRGDGSALQTGDLVAHQVYILITTHYFSPIFRVYGLGEFLGDVSAGSGISIDKTDPANPVISATGGGGGSTNVSAVTVHNTATVAGSVGHTYLMSVNPNNQPALATTNTLGKFAGNINSLNANVGSVIKEITILAAMAGVSQSSRGAAPALDVIIYKNKNGAQQLISAHVVPVTAGSKNYLQVNNSTGTTGYNITFRLEGLNISLPSYVSYGVMVVPSNATSNDIYNIADFDLTLTGDNL